MPAEDIFAKERQENYSPITNAVVVTPHNTNELPYVTRALYVGTGGDVKVTMQDSGTVVFVAVPTGTTLPLRVKVVFASDTTADDIVALW